MAETLMFKGLQPCFRIYHLRKSSDLKIVVTGTQYGYRRPDGVYVIPIGCLKD